MYEKHYAIKESMEMTFVASEEQRTKCGLFPARGLDEDKTEARPDAVEFTLASFLACSHGKANLGTNLAFALDREPFSDAAALFATSLTRNVWLGHNVTILNITEDVSTTTPECYTPENKIFFMYRDNKYMKDSRLAEYPVQTLH
ncbi:hypothetical protein WMY93_007310 [Mugilogobius chulae]|uniref:Uncharacterized protein n=1 Tax=Mugilogobius chulae TaxID=88201 RepID=A0AAW0PGA9_9GOBI